MFNLALPAGMPVRLTATARQDRGTHRWDVRVLAAEGGATRLVYGSSIGGRDLHQNVQIPAQDVNCQLEIRSRHETTDGFVNDQSFVEDDTPSRLQLGFCDLSRPGSRHDDVLLSFVFVGAEEDLAKRASDGLASQAPALTS